jgi:hypothetical protein
MALWLAGSEKKEDFFLTDFDHDARFLSVIVIFKPWQNFPSYLAYLVVFLLDIKFCFFVYLTQSKASSNHSAGQTG